MVNPSFGIIIPARYNSSRLPGKPLLKLGNKTLIEQVVLNAKKASSASFIAVATDNEDIVSAVEPLCKTVITSHEHPTGTDRVIECYQKLNFPVDIIINLQGDEPFFNTNYIPQLLNCFANLNCDIATLCYPLTEEIDNINKVKLVRAKSGQALYFSRSRIPFNRHPFQSYLGHVGVYAFKTTILTKLKNLEIGTLEQAESLEQLRWLENGLTIFTSEINRPTMGIDTPEDLEMANTLFTT